MSKEDIFQRAEEAAFDPDPSKLLELVPDLNKAYTAKGGSDHEPVIIGVVETLFGSYRQLNNQTYLVGAHILLRSIIAVSSNNQSEGFALNNIFDTERNLLDPEERRKSLKTIIKYMPNTGANAAGRLETLNKQHPEPPPGLRGLWNRFFGPGNG